MKTGIELIAEERKRQIEIEGWTIEHDSEHTNESLALAAVCYAMPSVLRRYTYEPTIKQVILRLWPWDAQSWKPSPENRVKELVKAGALIAAEIDRLNARKEENEKPSIKDAMKELDEKISLVKQRRTWDGVDVDKYMDEVRGRVSDDLEEAAEISFDEAKSLTEDYRDFLAKGLTENQPRPIGPHWFCEYAKKRFIAGAKWQEEQMMKDAVESEVTETCGISSVWIKTKQFKPGQKVRVIFMKEEENGQSD